MFLTHKQCFAVRWEGERVNREKIVSGGEDFFFQERHRRKLFLEMPQECAHSSITFLLEFRFKWLNGQKIRPFNALLIIY
jgi:hypothetical protein